MAAVNLPPVPPNLKTIQHYLKAASEHDKRDPIVAYWCRLFAMQTGMKIDSKSKEARMLLVALMDELEKSKHANKSNEAFTNEVVAQAHIENSAMKLFLWADTEDRAARFNKNVVKGFYTAGLLFDVLLTFGELTEEVSQHRKYAKWKASYIHNCLKNGETPVPGPQGDEDDAYSGLANASDASNYNQQEEDSAYENWPAGGGAVGFSPYTNPGTPSANVPSFQPKLAPPASTGIHAPPSTPADQASITPTDSNSGGSVVSGSYQVKTEDISKAQKFCKWAGSALQYEDVTNAIFNLEKALRLLKTGKED